MGRRAFGALLLTVIALVGLALFGSAVKTTVEGEREAGVFGRAALALASLPGAIGHAIESAFGDDLAPLIQVAGPPEFAFDGYDQLPSRPGVSSIPGLIARAERPRLIAGWRIVVGAFEIGGAPANAAVLISPELEIAKIWRLQDLDADGAPRPETQVLAHGFEVLPDGSVIVAFEGGETLRRIGPCGEPLWTTRGAYRYAVTPDEAGRSLWTLRGPDTVVQVALADGGVLREITMDEVIQANPQINVLEIRRRIDDALGANPRGEPGRWLEDPIHLNDVDPLPRAWARQFPRFRGGELLLSARSLNLLLAIDPKSLQARWWRIGQTRGQHDPDWLPDGRIVVIDNRPARHDTTVVAIGPYSYERTVLFDGQHDNFYSRIRGRQEWHDNGLHTISSPQQGRALELGAANQVMFEVFNRKPGDPSIRYVLTELRWLPPDFFEEGVLDCPR